MCRSTLPVATLLWYASAHVDAASPILGGIVGELSDAYPEEPRIAVEQAVASAMELAADTEKLPLDDQTCVRDYSKACPVGWADLGDATTCLAPFNYRGACPAKVTFGGLSSADKSATAARCNSVFPCVGAYISNYEAACPDGWTVDGGDCVAPATYSGPCVGRKSFTGFNFLEKASWGAACGIAWPRRSAGATRNEGFAKKSCAADHNSPCPSGWSLDGDSGTCRASTDYHGSCSYYQQFQHFSVQQKDEFAARCNVQWPCQKRFLS